MYRINIEEDIRPLTEFRAHAAEMIQHVQDTGRPLVITQHGKSAAVLLDVAAFEAMVEKLELLEEIRLAEAQADEGKLVSHEDVKRDLLARFKQ